MFVITMNTLVKKEMRVVCIFRWQNINVDPNGAVNALHRGSGRSFTIHESMFNPPKLDIEKKPPMSMIDQGVEDVIVQSNIH